ncbi:MAG: UvrD-helicase domain-containing protein, partial [Acetobacteraceae bacterium]|nr:UvrD-helicase domain-containing protein [Acetobacteraceae bacterium]
MTETPRQRANRAQRSASDPAVSAFVGASAGSGKTKLLTDRLLRLMLAGARPERIQCLTFTKAAAAEMAVRLQRTLGRWVTMPNDELEAALSRLDMAPSAETRRKARELFAKVLDLPGGMPIGTIHAFCQSLLRRFPLEAALSPHFTLADERDAADTMTEAREDMLAGAHSSGMQAALHTLAGLVSAEKFGSHVEALGSDRPRLQRAVALPDLEAAQRRALGVMASEAEILREGVNWRAERGLQAAANIVHRLGSPGCVKRAARILEWLARSSNDRVERWDDWCTEFLDCDGQPRADTAFVNKALIAAHPELPGVFQAECERLAPIADACRAARMARISAALVTLATPVLDAYVLRKQNSGLLDYDDLISHTSALLVDPGAAWVLYKLDGGLDHLLLDEVQDTAPAQWRIAEALIAEFFAGSGARDAGRTVFAVGDRKQSIYSFQGADAQEFDCGRQRWARRVQESGCAWRDVALDVSFRSTTPVLELVDAVFADPVAAEGVTDSSAPLQHWADRAGHAGAVELWPLAPLPDAVDPPAWSVADRNHGLQTAPQLLAETLAGWIKDQTGGAVPLESKGRPLAPGDVLVLVRRRNDFARALVRALKSRGVPVAGLDRLVLTEQPAVQDLIALADALLLPQDDLTFACLLTSPLGGLSDDDLLALRGDPDPSPCPSPPTGERTQDLTFSLPLREGGVARGQTTTDASAGSLWNTLRARAAERPEWERAASFFATLLGRVDYVSPYALFVEALGPLGGRARLFARLGAEAAEPIDELLNAALTYGRTHPPSLQGFLHWLRRSGAEVKREPEAAGNAVRVMTVHGAKGLQSPLVILPDTTAVPPDDGAILWADDPKTGTAVPLWAPRKDLRCLAAERLRDRQAQRRMAEHNRLLYVALTRAEDRLLVCGWQTRKEPREDCWYRLVGRGFSRLSAEPVETRWGRRVLRYSTRQAIAPETAGAVATLPTAPLPLWLGAAAGWHPAPPPAEPRRPQPLAPSRPEGVEFGHLPAAISPLAERVAHGDRFQRGLLVHRLLQHLPCVDLANRAEAARRYLDRPGNGLSAGAAEELVAEILAILDHPKLAPLFG